MNDLDRVLRRVTDDPGFAAHLEAEPRTALASYDLTDADFAELERRLHLPDDATAGAGAGVGAFFAPPEPPSAGPGPRAWPRAALAGALSAIVLVGAGAGYTLAATRGDPGPSAAGAPVATMTPVAFSRCPTVAGADSRLGSFHRGDHVWVMGRDDASRWLEVRGPDGAAVWVATAAVTVSGVDHLPVVPCSLPGATTDAAADGAPTAADPDPAGSTAPGTGDAAAPGDESAAGTPPGDPAHPTPTAPSGVITDPAPGPTVTAPGAGPSTPGAPADHAGPTIDATGGSPPDIWQHAAGAGGRCVTQTTSTVTAHITDPSDVAEARLDWTFAGTPGQHGTATMARSGATWSGVVGPIEWVAGAIPGSGTDVDITVRAVDGAGNATTATTRIHLHSAEECVG